MERALRARFDARHALPAAERARRSRSTASGSPALYEGEDEAWRSFADPAADIRALAPSVTCPVLFAWAIRDQFVQLRRSLPAIRRFPAARVEKFSAGHAAHLETPDAFAATVERFLADII